MGKIIFNGVITDRSEVKVDIEDRADQFGDGIYEVIRIYNGKMFTEQEHLIRLFESAEKIRLDLGYSLSEVSAMLTDLIHINKVEDGSVYLQFSRESLDGNINSRLKNSRYIRCLCQRSGKTD